jgi:hypothetical protein
MAATFAEEQRLPALEAILLALPDGGCSFHARAPVPDGELGLAGAALDAQLDRLAERQAELVRGG